MERAKLLRCRGFIWLFFIATSAASQPAPGTLFGITANGTIYSLSADFAEREVVTAFPLENTYGLAVSPTGEFFTVSEGAIFRLDIANATAEAIPTPAGYWIEDLFFDENGKMSVVGKLIEIHYDLSIENPLFRYNSSSGDWEELYTYLFTGSYSHSQGFTDPDELRSTAYDPGSDTYFSSTWKGYLIKLKTDTVSPSKTISNSFPGEALLFYSVGRLFSYQNNTFFEVDQNDGSTTEIRQIEPTDFTGFVSTPAFEVRQLLMEEDCLCLPEEVAGDASTTSVHFFNNSPSPIVINDFQNEITGLSLKQTLPITVPPKTTITLDFEVSVPEPTEIESKLKLITDEELPFSAYDLYLKVVTSPQAAGGEPFFLENAFGGTKLLRYDSETNPVSLRRVGASNLAINSKGQLFGFTEGKLIQLDPEGYHDRKIVDLPFSYIHEMIFDYADRLIFLVDSGEGAARKIQFYRCNPENSATEFLSETNLGHDNLEGGGFKAAITPDYFAYVAIQRSGLYEEKGPLFKVNMLTGTSTFINSLGPGSLRDMTFTASGKLMVAYGSKMHVMDATYLVTEQIYSSGEIVDLSSMMPRVGYPVAVDLGIVSLQEAVQQEYNFLNTSDQPVTIHEIVSEHADLSVSSFWSLPQTIAPGGVIPLQISLLANSSGTFGGKILLSGPDVDQGLPVTATVADFAHSTVSTDAVLLAIQNKIFTIEGSGLQLLTSLTIPEIDKVDISPGGKVYVTSRATIYQVLLSSGALKPVAAVMGVNFFNGFRLTTDSTYLAIGNSRSQLLKLDLKPAGQRLEKTIAFEEGEINGYPLWGYSQMGLGIWENEAETVIYSNLVATEIPQFVITQVDFDASRAETHIVNDSFFYGIDLDADRNGDLLALIHNRSNDETLLAKVGTTVDATEMLLDFAPGTSVALAVGSNADLSSIGKIISSAEPETEHMVVAYPNPFSSSVEFKLGTKRPSTVTVYDIAGKFITQLDVSREHVSWDGTSSAGTTVKKGLYLVKVLNRDGSVSTIKIIYEPN